MKFREVKTLEHLLKEYGASSGGAVGGGGHGASAKANKTNKSVASGPDVTNSSPTVTGQPAKQSQPEQPMAQTIKAKDVKVGAMVVDKKTGGASKVISLVNKGPNPEALIVKGPDGKLSEIPKDQDVDAIQPEKGNLATIDIDEPGFAKSKLGQFTKGMDLGKQLISAGKLSKIAKKKNKKIKIKNLKSKIKKLSRKRLKEADTELFEINFNQRSVAKEALSAPVRCGFEAETFFYSADTSSNSNVDDMSIGDIEYEYGDLPDQAYEDFQDWLYQKGQDEYLEDLIDEKVDEYKEDEDYLNDFIDSSNGPSSEAVERYKKDFEEEDPNEYENREEDGWEYMNWVREFVEEEYEEEYLDWLRDDIRDGNDLEDEAKELAEGDYDMSDWIYDQWSYMSSFLDDYGYEYSRSGDGVESCAEILYKWINENSEFKDYPEYGDYGDTNTTTAWAVENDSSIEPDEGAAAEIISPVFSSPRQMLTEMKSLFEWGEDEFGTNHSTGLHVTMSWQGEQRDPYKLKMALLLGDQYLLKEFDRINNSYTKSQYKSILKAAENMKRGGKNSFEEFENELSKHISNEKFQTIHFKNVRDREKGNELIEFRIAGGSDYQEKYEKIVKAVVRYATIMKAGYEKESFKKDYIDAVFRVMRKSTELDPKRVKDLEDRDDIASHPVIDSAKNIIGKKDYFDVVSLLSNSLNAFIDYENYSQPGADKEWKQSIKDYKKGTGSDPSWMGEAKEDREITGYIEPDRLAPSKRAKQRLQSAQSKFGTALAMLSRDLADGNNRGPVKAKDIGAFRSYATQLKLDDTALEKLAIEKMDDQNFGGSDKENIARLKSGIDTLFKKDIINEPEYFKPQQLDIIAGKMWQFYQSDDSQDNIKTDKLADLLLNLNPRLNKNDIVSVLKELSHERSQNGFVAKMRGSGWNTPATILSSGRIMTPDAAKELIKFLEPYKGYDHPTGKDHHVNIRSDDNYEEVAKSALVQKMKFRLDHLKELEDEDNEKYLKIKNELIKIADPFLDDILANEEEEEYFDSVGNDPGGFLSLRPTAYQDYKDFLVRSADKDDDLYNFITAFDDRIIRNTLGMLPEYYRIKEREPSLYSKQKTKKIIKKKFAAFKKFLTAFDKIFIAQGFIDLKAEISDKDRYDKRNKDFEKNIRNNAKAKFNIPSYSYVYFNKNFWETITDDSYDDKEVYLDNHLESFNTELNKDGKVFVIPAGHWADADDAYNGLSLIDTYEKSKNYFHTWRKPGYENLLNAFTFKYGIDFNDLIDSTYQYDTGNNLSNDYQRALKEMGIEVTHKGDSRKGEPGVEDLVPDEETANPKTGEPLNRSSAHSWENITDDAEEKRFNNFNWKLYPEKMKSVVAKEMKKDRYGSFQIALNNVLQKVVDKEIDVDIPDTPGMSKEVLMKAAGVSDLDGKSSYDIGKQTNWKKLADALKIERGVNEQGVELLRVVYNRFDGDHSWRPGAEWTPDGGNVVSTERWLAAVKASHEYIQKNYKVSGGNYFRTDADGNVGDDVSDVYSIPTSSNSDLIADYDKARSNYGMFNNMMEMGMQNYLARGEVNKLVSFLNNDDNPYDFKQTVLNTIRQNYIDSGPYFDSFQDALAASRRSNESVLQKFDKLTLEEQLRIVSKSTVLEKLSKKSEGPSSNALPDNSIPHLLNKLLAEPMPAGDLRKQMDAYWALPVPQMISDFRAIRGQGGDQADCRNILKQYIKSQLDPSIRKQVNLVEGKDDVIDRISDLPDDDEQTDKVVQYITQLLDDMGVGGRLASLTTQLDEIDDEDVKKSNVKLAKMISGIDMTPLERAQLFASWKQDTLVNVDKLLSGSGQTFSDIFKGYGNETYMTEFIDDLANVDSYGIGAGEFLLAVLSTKVKGIGSTGGSGDLIINGKNVEVKTKTSRNARFKDWHVQPDQTWASKVEAFREEFADIDEVTGAKATGMNSGQLSAMLKNPVLQQDPVRKKRALLSIMGIFKATNTNLTTRQYSELAKLIEAGDDVAFKQKYGAYNILNYLNIKRSDGELEGILFMNKKTKTVHYVKELADIQNLTLEVGTIYPISTNSIYPYPQIGVK